MKPLKTKVSITLDENVIAIIRKWQMKMIETLANTLT